MIMRNAHTHEQATKMRCGQVGACLGSQCMMWRWERATTSTRNEDMRGFCGLAGLPWHVRVEEAEER